MRFAKFMDGIIEEEIMRIEQTGERIRLKTLLKFRVLYTLVFGVIFLILMLGELMGSAFFVMVIYYILLYQTNNTSVIRYLAKKSPDTPISEIIEGDTKR